MTKTSKKGGHFTPIYTIQIFPPRCRWSHQKFQIVPPVVDCNAAVVVRPPPEVLVPLSFILLLWVYPVSFGFALLILLVFSTLRNSMSESIQNPNSETLREVSQDSNLKLR